MLGLIEVSSRDLKVKTGNEHVSFLHSVQLLWWRQRKGRCLECNELGFWGFPRLPWWERGAGELECLRHVVAVMENEI